MTRPPTHRAPSTQKGGPNLAVVGGALGVVVLIAILAVALTGGGSDDDAATKAEYGTVDVEGGALPALSDPAADPARGEAAPSLSSLSSDGTTITIDPQQEGRPIVLFFLAHWCPHCQEELPVLVDLQEHGAYDDVRAVAVLTGTTPSRPNFPPSAWLDEEGWTGERFFDDEESSAAEAYGLSSFPFAVFIDSDGRIAGRVTGNIPREQLAAILGNLS